MEYIQGFSSFKRSNDNVREKCCFLSKKSVKSVFKRKKNFASVTMLTPGNLKTKKV